MGDVILDLPNSLTNKRRNYRSTLLIIFLLFSVICVLFYIYTHIYITKPPTDIHHDDKNDVYSRLYKYQQNYVNYKMDDVYYSFAIVSDKDENSKVEDAKPPAWSAILKYGVLQRNEGSYSVAWETEDITLKSGMNMAGRGMELSELVFFDGKLLACDDRTGIVYEIHSQKVIPLYILTMGDGRSDKPIKCEWMTVVEDRLYVGSMGKEFVKDGKIVDTGAQWVKIIDRSGKIIHQNWTSIYEALREKSETKFPAYLLHEAIMWYPDRQEWVFLPRRLSREAYDEHLDCKKGTNTFFIASADFNEIKMGEVGELDNEKGTSSFKFIPYQNGDILQLKTIEIDEKIESYISVVNIYTKEVLMVDTLIGNVKFEGVEFI